MKSSKKPFTYELLNNGEMIELSTVFVEEDQEALQILYNKVYDHAKNSKKTEYKVDYRIYDELDFLVRWSSISFAF